MRQPRSALAAIPSGYGEGVYEGLRYGVTVRKSRDGKRTNLFARALAGGDVVSFKPLPTEVGRGLFASLRNTGREGRRRRGRGLDAAPTVGVATQTEQSAVAAP